MMAHDYDVVFGIEFLMSAGGNVAHGNLFCRVHVRGFELPWLAYVEQR